MNKTWTSTWLLLIKINNILFGLLKTKIGLLQASFLINYKQVKC